MPHDFIRFPELTNSQMQFYYLESPHKQITENINVEVVKVVDGDTIRVLWAERDFDFPVRFAKINAPEMSEGGEDSKNWLEEQIMGKEVELILTPQRVEKWGRILAEVIHQGINMGEVMLRDGMANLFETLPDWERGDIWD